MGDVEQGAELVLEPQERGRADAVEGLERDRVTAPAVKRAVNSAHAAAAQHAQDVEAFDARPARVGGVSRLVRGDPRGVGSRPGAGADRELASGSVVVCAGKVANSSGSGPAGDAGESNDVVESVTVNEPLVRRNWWTSN